MLKNIIKVLFANIIVMLTSIINTLVIPKIMSIDGYDEYQTFMLFISYVGLMMFGFHGGLFIKYGGKRQEDIDIPQFKSEMSLIIISQSIMSIILCIFSFATKNALIFATSLCILTSNFVSCYKYLYQAWDKFTQYSVINVFQSIGFSGVVVILGIFCKPVDAKKVIITYILINAICFAIVLREYIRGCKGIKRNPLICC